MQSLQDSHGRRFHYLRLSVTDACNFRCVYCLPEGYRRPAHPPEPLRVDEIRNLVAAFAELGFWKVRLTGGEPTVRRDIVEIARAVSSVPGIRVVGLSTNGHRLRELAPALRTAGVTAVNVSVDSLDPARFGAITGSPRLGEVLEGVEAALAAGISPVKLNAVLLRGMNDEDIDGLIDWTRGSPVDVRFIELMRTGRNAELFEKRHVSGGELRLRLLRAGWRERARGPADGPAVAYGNPAHVGRVGIIAPYSEGFCANCNRLRVSSIGGLRLCLFGKGDHSLRPWLSDAGRRDELIAEIRRLIAAKPERHHLKEGDYGNTWNLAATGG